MWLIDVSTFKLRFFPQHDVWKDHPYAILSHTWGEDEVTFQDMQDLERARMKLGFWKIEKTCSQAKVKGLKFAWVDTCCIDKTSSAELQEAINSMFGWYERAKECYAYLTDISLPVDGIEALPSSRWFSRGWTLQELLAPDDVHFHDRDWNYLGSRTSLRAAIAARTRIPMDVLGYVGPLANPPYFLTSKTHLAGCSVAQKMSWAAERQTTRLEDRAYSLLGIFGVTMPLLYGEGRRSFVRLQEEILRVSQEQDFSLLLWEQPKTSNLFNVRLDLLADTPDVFGDCASIRHQLMASALESDVDMALSAVGLRLRVNLMPIVCSEHGAHYAAILNCHDELDCTSIMALKLHIPEHPSPTAPESANLVLRAAPLSSSGRTTRIDIVEARRNAVPRLVFIARHDWPLVESRETRYPGYVWLRFSAMNISGPSWRVLSAHPEDSWDLARLTFSTRIGDETPCIKQDFWRYTTGAIAMERQDAPLDRILLTFSPDLFVRIYVIDPRTEINQDVLKSYCLRFIAEIEQLLIKHDAAKVTAESQSARLHDGACFVVAPEQKKFFGRELGILHFGCAPSLDAFEEDCRLKSSTASSRHTERQGEGTQYRSSVKKLKRSRDNRE